MGDWRRLKREMFQFSLKCYYFLILVAFIGKVVKKIVKGTGRGELRCVWVPPSTKFESAGAAIELRYA